MKIVIRGAYPPLTEFACHVLFIGKEKSLSKERKAEFRQKINNWKGVHTDADFFAFVEDSLDFLSPFVLRSFELVRIFNNFYVLIVHLYPIF